MNFLSIKNWGKYQHYKNRNPIWIKLYTRLLDADDVTFWKLSDASKLLYVLTLLLASRHENRIPYDVDWLKPRLGIKTKPNYKELINAGFIKTYDDASNVLADCYKDAMPDKDKEIDKENIDPLEKYPLLSEFYPELIVLFQGEHSAFKPPEGKQRYVARKTLADLARLDGYGELEIAMALRWLFLITDPKHGLSDAVFWRGQVGAIPPLRNVSEKTGLTKFASIYNKFKAYA